MRANGMLGVLTTCSDPSWGKCSPKFAYSCHICDTTTRYICGGCGVPTCARCEECVHIQCRTIAVAATPVMIARPNGECYICQEPVGQGNGHGCPDCKRNWCENCPPCGRGNKPCSEADKEPPGRWLQQFPNLRPFPLIMNIAPRADAAGKEHMFQCRVCGTYPPNLGQPSKCAGCGVPRCQDCMACPCGTEEPAIHLIASKDGNISRIISLNRIYINEESMMREIERRGPRSFPHALIHGPGHIQDLKEQYPEAGRRRGSKAVHGSDLYDSLTTPITKASDPPFKHSIVYNRKNAAQTNVQVPEYI